MIRPGQAFSLGTASAVLRRSSFMCRRTLTVAVLLALAACKRPDTPHRPVARPPVTAPGAVGGDAAEGQVIRGKVLEKIDVPQYSYLRLATASGETWAAVQKTDTKVGDEVGVGNAFPMRGFESKELNRKFEVVYFGTLAGEGGEAAPMPPAAGGAAGGPMAGASEATPSPGEMAAQHQAAISGRPDVKVEKVAKAGGPDGRTVEEIWGQRERLKGKTVTVRGHVVNFTPAMGKNFLHLRDGTGDAEKKNNDVTVTTMDVVAVGDVVTARGVVVTDKNLGFGYAYPVMLEDAKVTK
jgi:hypothetical protein